MTTNTGDNRARYSKIETAPSRFSNYGNDYRAWAERADNYAKCGDPTPWVSRIDPEDRRSSPDAFPESIGTWGVNYAPRGGESTS